MLIMKYGKLKSNMMANFGYSDFQARETIKKIRKFDRNIKKAFAVWTANGALPEFEVEGFTIRDLIDKLHMNTIAAFLYLDWLKKEPAAAKKSLLRGYDTVKISPAYREKLDKLIKESGGGAPQEEPSEDTSDIVVEDASGSNGKAGGHPAE